ncbi:MULTISPECIES: AfsR/SARP family transcriptional regulator [Amycolatopsis]|uniref:SARP family transcriptional regulator n=1 Tax=Amycolatopsis bullii TaxID=941987 RepID=A0ABQ3KPG8_9PSEU|nr:BTAD domain-containing putative transcriptional regulator [Amycolatopsis bullii]GHG42692.1 SARP family transcriptional regulator [Amycolatopsis bullii]
MLRLGLLGDVVAHLDGDAIDLGPAKQRCVLAALAVDAGRLVPAERVITRVWGPDAPERARGTLHSYISRLRQALTAAEDVDLVRRSGGYLFQAGATVVDVARFRDLCARASVGDHAHAVPLLTEALQMWRGEALSGLTGQWAEAERDLLHAERLAAELDLVDARLGLGEGEQLVVRLAALSAEHPLDERVAGQYILALCRAGRAADALTHYRTIRTRLARELGTDPNFVLQDLHQRVLAADPALHPAGARATSAVVPRQLPAVPRPFVGREAELDRLGAGIPDNNAGATVVISAVSGAGGIGKTWLALQWAHLYAERFPDGQLFVDLRGFSHEGTPMTSEVAVRGFLDALGVEPARVPVLPHAQAALFRSLVAGKRMLLVLDNAADTTQVVPMLPGGDGCLTLVTSRNRLPGLITGHGARHLALDVLPDAEARALLADRLGADRIAAEPAAVDELVRLCGGYPLALSIVAGHATTYPDRPLAALVTEMRDRGVGALADEDPIASLPTVLSWSCRSLPGELATAFVLLGTVPAPHISLHAAASVLDLPLAETTNVLRALEQASLLGADSRGRYRMHDLIRQYAAETALRQPTHGARRRVLDYFLHGACAAEKLLSPQRRHIEPAPAASGCRCPELTDYQSAADWFDAEHPCLLAAQRSAADDGRHDVVWQLAWALNTYHYRRGLLHDEHTVWQAGLTAARQLAHAATEAQAHRFLGRVLGRLNRLDEAFDHLHDALHLVETESNRPEEAAIHGTLGQLWTQRGDDLKALNHMTNARTIFRELGDSIREAQSLNNVGWLHAQLGNYEDALADCRKALEMHRHHQYRDGEGHALDNLGYIECASGHHTDAVEYYERALALWRELGDSYEEANALDGLGRTHAAAGDQSRALATWRQALELYLAQHRIDDADRVQEQLNLATT